jgi:Protein kinase domain/C2 domain
MGFDTLHILVHKARDVAAMDHGKSSDPFVTLKSTFNKQSFKTKIHKKTLAPVWEEEFKFFVTKALGEVVLKLWDHDRFSKNDFMGEITLKVAELADGEVHEEWFELAKEPIKKKLQPEPGAIHLRVWFTGPGWPPKGKGEKKSSKESSESASASAAAETTSAPAPSESVEIQTTNANLEDLYEVGKVLGRGAFSEVKLGKRKTDGLQCAIKCISKKQVDEKELTLLEREIDIMKKLKHPHIIQLLQVIDTKETLYLVLEIAEGGELFDAIVDRGNYTESDAARLVKQMLEAIQYIHRQGIAHRDLKV